MEDDESPHQNRASQHGQRNCEPPGDGAGKIHRAPEADIRDERVHHLPHRAAGGRLLVVLHPAFPSGSVRAFFGTRAIRVINHKIKSGRLYGLPKRGTTRSWKVDLTYAAFEELQPGARLRLSFNSFQLQADSLKLKWL